MYSTTLRQCAIKPLMTENMSNVFNINPQDLKDAFKQLRRSGVWEVRVSDCKLENMQLLDKGRIVYRLSRNGETLLQGNYSKFKNLINQ